MKRIVVDAPANTHLLPLKVGRAIIFAPASELVPTALESLLRGGRLALAGIHLSCVPLLNGTGVLQIGD